MNLFDLIDDSSVPPIGDDTWRPEAPPSLSQDKEIVINVETNGLRWWDGDRPIAISVFAQERAWYLPFKHRGGGNLSEETIKEWMLREVRGKYIRNINTRFDNHMIYAWGIDLEAQGNTLSDVSHYAALLDDHRLQMNLDSLIRDYLRVEPMRRLDERKMQSYSAGMAAPRAMYNVWAVNELTKIMWPQLTEQDLHRVRALEDAVIYVVCEMERNGTLIDQELLAKWIRETKLEFERSVMSLFKMTGLQLNPNSSKDAEKLYKHYNLPITEFTATGAASFTDEVIKVEHHPAVVVFRHAKKMAGLNSRLLKYQKCISSDGKLRYALHQLRTAKNEEGGEGGETGTVTGRFTSTEIVRGEGTNIQQVMKPEKQFLTYGDEYFIRDLHIPPPGLLWFSTDAEQIQYRLFASEAGNPRVLAAYAEDPWMSFHKYTLKRFRQYKPDLPYRRCKDINFAKVFAAGPSKLGLMLGFITKHQFEELRAQKANRYHPLLATTLEILKIYDQEIPEVDRVTKEASEIARVRGYIRTILGRRIRFPNGEFLHKALNGRIQGSEADIVKTKAVELYKARKDLNLTLCFQVHDEFDGYVPDAHYAKKAVDFLNEQSFSHLVKVPILWGMKTGESWGDCSRDELKELREQRVQGLI